MTTSNSARNTNRFATVAFVLAGGAIGAVGLLEDKLKYVALGAAFLCIATSMFWSGRRTAGDGPDRAPGSPAQQTGADPGNAAEPSR